MTEQVGPVPGGLLLLGMVGGIESAVADLADAAAPFVAGLVVVAVSCVGVAVLTVRDARREGRSFLISCALRLAGARAMAADRSLERRWRTPGGTRWRASPLRADGSRSLRKAAAGP